MLHYSRGAVDLGGGYPPDRRILRIDESFGSDFSFDDVRIESNLGS